MTGEPILQDMRLGGFQSSYQTLLKHASYSRMHFREYAWCTWALFVLMLTPFRLLLAHVIVESTTVGKKSLRQRIFRTTTVTVTTEKSPEIEEDKESLIEDLGENYEEVEPIVHGKTLSEIFLPRSIFGRSRSSKPKRPRIPLSPSMEQFCYFF